MLDLFRMAKRDHKKFGIPFFILASNCLKFGIRQQKKPGNPCSYRP